jgi:hypothetical protein
MYNSKDNSMAVVDWLEEIPIEELPEGECQFIIRDFREGRMEVQEAIALLEHDFQEELKNYIAFNFEIKKMIQEINDLC